MAIKLYGMICGYLRMPQEFLVSGTDGIIDVPIPAYLIEHPKGSVVFDTGLEVQLHEPDCDHAEALGPLQSLASAIFSPGEDVAGRLLAAGRDPAKIDIMINSHLHIDHAGGNALLPNARWIVQEREYAAAHTPEAQEKHYYRPRLFDLGHDLKKIDGEFDIFGDGAAVCIPTHGHTAGHQSLKLKLDGGDVILTADACYMCKALNEMRLPPGFLENADDMLCTFHRFREFRDRGGALIYGHEPGQWSAPGDGPLREIGFTRAVSL